MTSFLPFATSAPLLSPQDLAVNQNFYGPNYLVNGASVDSNTLALASLRNPFLQRNPFLNANELNSFDDLSTFGVGSDFTQAALLSNLHQSSPALLQRAKNEVPLARIGLQQFQHQLAFQDKSEELQLGFQNISEQRQLAFADRTSVRDLGLQKEQLKLEDTKNERGFLGNLIGTLAPAFIGLISSNQQGAREERMFKYAQQNKVDDVKEKYETKDRTDELKRRIAQLERKLDRYRDNDDDYRDDHDRTVKPKKKRKRKDDDDYGVRTVDKYGDSSWVVVKAKASAKSKSA